MSAPAIATFPWVGALVGLYEATGVLGVNDFANVMAWYERCSRRLPAICGKMVGML